MIIIRIVDATAPAKNISADVFRPVAKARIASCASSPNSVRKVS